MSDYSKPDLDFDAAVRQYDAHAAAAQSEPLRIPPGCAAPVESLSAAVSAALAAPVAKPPGVSQAGGDRPTRLPPETDDA